MHKAMYQQVFVTYYLGILFEVDCADNDVLRRVLACALRLYGLGCGQRQRGELDWVVPLYVGQPDACDPVHSYE
jgi:hypothetical protein